MAVPFEQSKQFKQFKRETTGITGCLLFTPKVYSDKRGSFVVTHNKYEVTDMLRGFAQKGEVSINLVQDNQSTNKKGVLRGMHMQAIPYEQSKLVRVAKGKVLDVVFDMRPHSRTFLHYIAVELDDKKCQMLWIPAGCLHGFLALEEDTIFCYKVTGEYKPEAERGFRWDDPLLGINWNLAAFGLAPESIILSDKDANLPTLTVGEIRSLFEKKKEKFISKYEAKKHQLDLSKANKTEDSKPNDSKPNDSKPTNDEEKIRDNAGKLPVQPEVRVP